jgi:hypothetical protein
VSFISMASADAARLGRALAVGPAVLGPDPPAGESWSWDWADELTAWRNVVDALPPSPQVVVCTWLGAVPAVPLVDLTPTAWRRSVEWPTALWFSTLVAAAGRCTDGGAMVVVVDRPASIDAIGHSTTVTVAEGITNLVRSLAAAEADRGVRVNAVVSELRTEVPVAGAVRMLLSADAAGISGTELSATGAPA